ncbi:hypothetical protein EDD11_008729 [Mortierella claussenii]|nr:hypothetical protein EDD11_008729 [Mortierella claussenii]
MMFILTFVRFNQENPNASLQELKDWLKMGQQPHALHLKARFSDEEEDKDEVVIVRKYTLNQIREFLEKLETFWLLQDYDTQEFMSISRKLMAETRALKQKCFRQATLDRFFV